MASATIETMIEPTSSGMIPYQSCQKLAVIQSRPNRNEVTARYAGTGASRTLDYFSTLNMRRRGRQEIFLTNDAVDNHAAFAAIEVAGTGVSIGAAYIFHRTGHHKLERWTSIVHISAATTGAVRNYCLKTAHPAATPTP